MATEPNGQNQILLRTHTIVNVIAAISSLDIVAEETKYCLATCASGHKYHALCKNLEDYLRKWPCCPKCGCALKKDNIRVDEEICGANVEVLWKHNNGRTAAIASVQLTTAALRDINVKKQLNCVDASLKLLED